MTPRSWFVVTLAVSLFNGLTSPLLPLLFLLTPIWLPEFVTPTNEVRFYSASLAIAFATLLVAGVPAALFERFKNKPASDGSSMSIWLGAAILLTLPGLQQLL